MQLLLLLFSFAKPIPHNRVYNPPSKTKHEEIFLSPLTFMNPDSRGFPKMSCLVKKYLLQTISSWVFFCFLLDVSLKANFLFYWWLVLLCTGISLYQKLELNFLYCTYLYLFPLLFYYFEVRIETKIYWMVIDISSMQIW